MSTAVICLAHMNTSRGIDLLAQYFDGLADMYIHVDKKAKTDPYINSVASNKHLAFIEDNHPIFWGGFNTVRACVSGLRQAMRSKAYDRFVYITEDTIPLVSRDVFRDRMSSDVEWIQSYSVNTPEWAARYTRYFYYDSRATTPRPMGIIEREWKIEDSDAISRMEILRRHGKHHIDELRSGGTWWALTRSSIEKFLSTYDSNLHLRESFEFSAIPEEQFIHTVLGGTNKMSPLVYTNFNRDPKPYVFRSLADIKSENTGNFTMLRKVALGMPDIEAFVRTLM